VLERLLPLADELIVVDDGSVDRTRELVMAFSETRPNVRFISFPQNKGMSAAYYRAFQEVARRVDLGELSADDVILTVDADGQHDPEEVDDLVAHLVDNHLDAVIARRDLSIYTAYKRAGNFLMSMWASIWAGTRLYDVESGYRAFRVGALLQALRYYKGYKYSETVEVAVIMPRMGYRVDNRDFIVPVPVFRSNPRMKDFLIDVAAIPAAAWRLEARRHAPAGINGSWVYYLALAPLLLLGFMALTVLRRNLFLGSDSMQHYSHVWWISDQLFHHASLPLRFDLLDSGDALTFPYGFVPYLAGALLHPILGDWAVSLLMVLGVLGVAWAAGLARPSLRDPWLLLLFVLNPFFIDALYSFQFASVWSMVFFFLFVWCFEKNSSSNLGRVGAVVLLWLTVSTHPFVGGCGAAGYGVYLLLADRERLRSYVATGAVAGIASLPFIYMTLSTPAVGENNVTRLAVSLADTLGRRGTVLFFPLVAPFVAAWVRRNYVRVLPAMLTLTVIGIGFSIGAVVINDMNRGTYPGLFHASTDAYAGFFKSAEFFPGAHYRVMEPTDSEDGAYRFLRHGAVLTNEFFTESYRRRDWSEAEFACYAAYKGIDFDVLEASYNRNYNKNEAGLLEQLVLDRKAAVIYSDTNELFTVYDIRPLVSQTPKPESLSQCGL
jgi:glycosyltransferase involved in cell wall biosynthesis